LIVESVFYYINYEKGKEFIKDGDFIMVFARSKVVENVFISAHQSGKKFTIIIVDNPPFHEGKTLLKNLS
jgi:translation initiation factor eIF-2B subunit delta